MKKRLQAYLTPSSFLGILPNYVSFSTIQQDKRSLEMVGTKVKTPLSAP